jgi:hypothetical protein
VEKINEVCFKFAHWRLTEKDGQLGIAFHYLSQFADIDNITPWDQRKHIQISGHMTHVSVVY